MLYRITVYTTDGWKFITPLYSFNVRKQERYEIGRFVHKIEEAARWCVMCKIEVVEEW